MSQVSFADNLLSVPQKVYPKIVKDRYIIFKVLCILYLRSLDIAVSLLDNSIEVYCLDKASLSKVCRLSGHEARLTEVVFSPNDEHLLYSTGHDGVKLWDTRTSGTCAQEYKGEEISDLYHNYPGFYS